MLISIVTICFNNLDGLQKTYASIIDQSYREFSWIVIDGGSNDGSLEFLKGLKKDSIIDLNYISEPDNGVYDAMNKGIKMSFGDYIIFLNAGDYFYSNDILKDIFSNYADEYALIYGNYFRELKNGQLALITAKPIYYIYHSLPTSHQAIFYNRKKLSDLRYNLKYKISSDYFLTAKFIKTLNLIENKDYLIVDEAISVFEYNGMSRNNLAQLYVDAFNIQEDVLKLNVFFRVASYVFKYLRNKLL